MTEVILIGRERTPVDDAADRLLDRVMGALEEFDTETLEAISALRSEVHPDGWMQKMINGYVEMYR